ncbi:MAG: TorF family putative porin [Woeseia sp.]
MSPVALACHNCRFARAVFVLLGCQMFVIDVSASELSGIATLTSEYIYRGLAMSDGDPAIQLGVDYEHGSGLFVGAWASTIDLTSPLGQRDIELDYYAGYHYSSKGPVDATITALRYTYPGHTGIHSYDHNEVLVDVTLWERYSIELGYTSNLYGLKRVGRHVEFRSRWPIANAWVIGAGLGSNDLSDVGSSRYLHWDIGASARLSRLTVDLRWYDNQEPDGFALQASADSQFVISISAAF